MLRKTKIAIKYKYYIFAFHRHLRNLHFPSSTDKLHWTLVMIYIIWKIAAILKIRGKWPPFLNSRENGLHFENQLKRAAILKIRGKWPPFFKSRELWPIHFENQVKKSSNLKIISKWPPFWKSGEIASILKIREKWPPFWKSRWNSLHFKNLWKMAAILKIRGKLPRFWKSGKSGLHYENQRKMAFILKITKNGRHFEYQEKWPPFQKSGTVWSVLRFGIWRKWAPLNQVFVFFSSANCPKVISADSSIIQQFIFFWGGGAVTHRSST